MESVTPWTPWSNATKLILQYFHARGICLLKFNPHVGLISVQKKSLLMTTYGVSKWWLLGVITLSTFSGRDHKQHSQRTCTGSFSPSFGLCRRSNHSREEMEASYLQITHTVCCMWCDCRSSGNEMDSVQQSGKKNRQWSFQKVYITRSS